MQPNVDSRRATENREFHGFTRRILRAYGRRVATSDPQDLADLVAVRRELDTVLSAAVAGLRDAGYSWTEIAKPLGVSRQACEQRWGGRK